MEMHDHRITTTTSREQRWMFSDKSCSILIKTRWAKGRFSCQLSLRNGNSVLSSSSLFPTLRPSARISFDIVLRELMNFLDDAQRKKEKWRAHTQHRHHSRFPHRYLPEAFFSSLPSAFLSLSHFFLFFCRCQRKYHRVSCSATWFCQLLCAVSAKTRNNLHLSVN